MILWNSIEDMNKTCQNFFRAHWQCLENHNQQMFHCRQPEQSLNKCVYDALGLKKTIPNAPTDEIPVFERPKQIFSYDPLSKRLPDDELEKLHESIKAKEADAAKEREKSVA